MNRVIIATNYHPDYLFLAPLTAILWATRTGYRPTIFGPASKAVAFLEHSGMVDWHYAQFQNDRMAVKLSRWYSAFACGKEDDLLLSDADCWPVNGAFWDRPLTKLVTCFYGDAYQNKRHATHGFRAKAWVLADICEGKTRDGRLSELRKLPEDDERRWSDDASQAELVLKWMAEHPNDYELVERGPSPPKDRIDRSNWPSTFDLAGKVDAHLPRDASDRRVWMTIYPLFEKLAPDWAGWARAYYESWSRSFS